jgi:hypothetical protein
MPSYNKPITCLVTTNQWIKSSNSTIQVFWWNSPNIQESLTRRHNFTSPDNLNHQPRLFKTSDIQSLFGLLMYVKQLSSFNVWLPSLFSSMKVNYIFCEDLFFLEKGTEENNSRKKGIEEILGLIIVKLLKWELGILYFAKCLCPGFLENQGYRYPNKIFHFSCYIFNKYKVQVVNKSISYQRFAFVFHKLQNQ